MPDTTDVAQPTEDPGTKHPQPQASRLNQALAWVGVIAGGLFIVAAIFLAGFFLDWSEHAHMRMGDMTTAHGATDCCADMKPGGMKPGGMKPSAMGPEMMGPHPAR